MSDRERFHRTADLMGLFDTHRWTIIKMNRPQSVAEHSFGVAVISWALAEDLGFGIETDLMLGILKLALIHDAPESLTGDINGQFKRDYPRMKKEIALAEGDALPWWVSEIPVDPRIKKIIKVADCIEAIVYIRIWGVGPRADAVRVLMRARELEEAVGSLCEVIPMTRYDVTKVAHAILNSLEGEADCYQLRRPHK
jgi:hypothetical protein